VQYTWAALLDPLPLSFDMTSFAEKTSKKLFEKHIQQYAPADPLYENYTDRKGRQKRRKVRYFTAPINHRRFIKHILINAYR
jgi:hypothetical protein